MLDYESQRKLIIVFILGFVLTVIGVIVALIFIWMPENETEVDEYFKVGKVTVTDSSEPSIIQKYYKELYVFFLNNDIESLYNKTGKDYLKYTKMDKEDLREFFINKGVLSRGLELVQYKTYIVDGYSNVYELDLKVKDEAYSINVVIRENTPDNYTIAFDMFIDYKEDVYKATLSSVEMDIYEVIRYTNSVQYEFKLTNNYDKTIKINSGNTGNPIILVNAQDQTKRPIMTTMVAAEFAMAPKEIRDCTAVFQIEENYDYIYFNKLVIKNVEFTGIAGVSNLEFELF